MTRLATALLLSLGLARPPATRADSSATAGVDSLTLAPLIAHGSIEQHKNVEHVLDRVLKHDRANVTALLLAGRLAVVEEKYSMARSYFQRVLKLMPGNAEAHREIGFLWAREWARYRESRPRTAVDLGRVRLLVRVSF